MTGSKQERDFAEALAIQIDQSFDVAEGDELPLDQHAEVVTFDEAGLLSGNAGLVVRLPDGREFQLTIVQSAGDDDETEA